MRAVSNFTLEVFAAASWGDAPDEIPLALEDYPLFAEVSAEQMRKVRAPLRIRLDAWGGLHALSDAMLRTLGGEPVYLHHFDTKGQVVGRTPLPSVEQCNDWVMLDYVVDADGNCYLLERIRPQQSSSLNNRLRKINEDGEAQWSRTGLVSREEFDFRLLKGTFTRLLMDGRSRLFLPATEHTGDVAEVDPMTGAVAQVYTSDKFSNAVFMNEKGTIFYVLYFPDVNRRGLGRFSLSDQRFEFMVGDDELYGWLIYPIGVDASSNFFVWKDSAVARITFDGRVDVMAALDNVVVRVSDGAVFSSHSRSDDEGFTVVRVERRSPAGASVFQELRLPPEFSGQRGGWKLVHVDEQERRFVFGGEEPGKAGTLLVYSQNGDLEETVSPPPDLLPIASSLERHPFWAVDAQGRIYLPVTDPQGFKVVRLKSAARREEKSHEGIV